MLVVIVRVRVVSRKTVVVVGDWRFDYLSGSHLQSHVKWSRQMMVFMSLVLVVIGPFCRDSIGREDSGVFRYWSVVVLLFFRSVYCSFGCVWCHRSVVCTVQVIVGICWEVRVLSLCTSFPVGRCTLSFFSSCPVIFPQHPVIFQAFPSLFWTCQKANAMIWGLKC